MKLFPKIISVGVIGLLVAAIIAAVGIYSTRMLNDLQAERNTYRAFQSALTTAKNAHLNWLQTISSAILAAKPKLTIGTDGTQCAFGKWYYSEGGEIAKTLPEEFQKAFADIADDHLLIHKLGGDLVEGWNPEDLAPAIELTNSKILPTAEKVLGALSVLEKLSQDKIDETMARSEWLTKNQHTPAIVTLVIGIFIIIPYSWLTARGIINPMHIGERILDDIVDKGQIKDDVPDSLLRRRDEIGVLCNDIKKVLEDYRAIARMMEKLAEGDWQHTVQTKSEDDVLNKSVAQMFDHVNDTLREINKSAQQVATASSEVSNAAQGLAGGTQESAASLEEISASMNEISAQTKQNAEKATAAKDLAQKASKATAEGQGAMKEMTTAMEQITKNSAEIQRVIKVIDDIAFQTNLLALNAAVEAARAGQHGKGFAVVAEEVRNLASRSAKAAKETSELIAKSGHEIEKGATVAARTAGMLDTIVDQITQTTELVSDIAVASNEQAEGVNQVTQGLTQIDSVTQQNTATAEESASAANEMSSMAANLQKLVAQFKLRT